MSIDRKMMEKENSSVHHGAAFLSGYIKFGLIIHRLKLNYNRSII